MKAIKTPKYSHVHVIIKEQGRICFRWIVCNVYMFILKF